MVANIINENKDKFRRELEKALLEDPIRALKDLAWLVPKELMIEGTMKHTHSKDLTQEDMQQIRAFRKAREESPPIEHATH